MNFTSHLDESLSFDLPDLYNNFLLWTSGEIEEAVSCLLQPCLTYKGSDFMVLP
jgi:hypothetical protein